MLLVRPLSLQLIFHNYNQFKSFFNEPKLNDRERDRSYMNERSTYIFFSLFLFFVAGLFLFLVFFFFLLLFFQHVALFSSFLSVLSAPVRASYCWWFVLVFISFYFFQSQHFSLSLFVDVVLWCLKLSLTVTRFVLNPRRTLLAQAPN